MNTVSPTTSRHRFDTHQDLPPLGARAKERKPDHRDPPALGSTHRDLVSLERMLNASGSGAADLTGPDGRLRDDLKLPRGMNPLHVACLAQDKLLLQETLSDARYDHCVDKRVDESDAVTKVITDRSVSDETGGSSPLHLALLNGWNEGAHLLIDALEAENILEHTINQSGSSVLSMAVSNCDIAVVERLCQHFSTSPDYEAYLHHTTEDGKNLLHYAAQRDDPGVFKYIRSQMLQNLEKKYDRGEKHAKTPLDAEAGRDSDGNAPVDLIRDKIGQLYVQHLDANEDLRHEKLYLGNCDSDWERYYIENYHGDRISWVSLWERCNIV